MTEKAFDLVAGVSLPIDAPGGRYGAVVRLLPPLTVTDREAGDVVGILLGSVAEANGTWRG